MGDDESDPRRTNQSSLSVRGLRSTIIQDSTWFPFGKQKEFGIDCDVGEPDQDQRRYQIDLTVTCTISHVISKAQSCSQSSYRNTHHCPIPLMRMQSIVWLVFWRYVDRRVSYSIDKLLRVRFAKNVVGSWSRFPRSISSDTARKALDHCISFFKKRHDHGQLIAGKPLLIFE